MSNIIREYHLEELISPITGPGRTTNKMGVIGFGERNARQSGLIGGVTCMIAFVILSGIHLSLLPLVSGTYTGYEGTKESSSIMWEGLHVFVFVGALVDLAHHQSFSAGSVVLQICSMSISSTSLAHSKVQSRMGDHCTFSKQERHCTQHHEYLT